MFGSRLGMLILVALVIPCPAGWAQESASSGIVGQVTDSTGGALPGATVTVTNTGTNAQRTTVTDSEGRFTIPNLPPATYQIRVELSGFQTAELTDVTLRNGEIARPNVVLGLASVAENVTVTGLSPLLQTTNASVTQTITQKQIEDLPVAGRTLLSFAALSAGVTPQAFNRGTQFGAAGSSRSQYVTVEGGRDSSTNYAIDGVYVRSLRFNNLSLNPPLDAVQEVNVLRNAFTTEYGQGQAVVSIVTKSGTNKINGSAYEYLRDSVLAPTVPAPNNAGSNNFLTVRDLTDDADSATVRSDQVLSAKHNLFERFLYYDGRQLNPGAFTYTNFPQKGRNLAVGDTWVISSAVVNEIRVGYNYAYHLNAPISLDNRNWVGDIGLRNLAGSVDPLDYGRPGFTMTGFSGNGEGGITPGATENIGRGA